MSSIPTAQASALLAIFWGGFACGALDITQAFVAWGLQDGVNL
jgi:hypothetical protein